MSVEHTEQPETIDLSEMFQAKGNVYVLRARGDTMIDDHICDRDYVVFEQRETAVDGQTVVALLDTGEATMKRYYREGDKVRLQPANPKYEAKVYDADRVKIQGVLIGVLRSYA